MKKGLLLINAYLSDEDYLYQATRMQEEFLKRGVRADIVRNDDFSLRIKNGEIFDKTTGYDFCVYWDKDKYVLNMLEKTGMRVFNKRSAIEKCDDKMTTYIELCGQGISMPDTAPGLLCFDKNAVIEEKTIDEVESLFGYPLVVKQSFGSRGKEVYLVRNREDLREKMEQVKCRPHLFQKYIESSYGKDVRIIVIGEEVIGGMLRISEGDFRSNIGNGGTGSVFMLDEDMKGLALKIKDVLGLDYCGIDVLFGKDGPVVCEVNSNAYFREFERITDVNVAAKYVDYVLDRLDRE